MRLPPTSSLALRLCARQVITTTALLWRLPAQRDSASVFPRPHYRNPSRQHSVLPRLHLQGFAL